jgi:hypothetical protein
MSINKPSPEEWDSLPNALYADPMMSIYKARRLNAKDKQVGGNHYKDMAIQPIDYCVENKLDPYQTNIIKYASRMYSKNQCLSDLDKIIHYAELAKENAIKKGIK